MARSLIQRRQDARRERNETYDATLRRVHASARPPPDCENALREAQHGLGTAVREAAAWRPKLKTRDPARLRLAAARHLFALYPVPHALERIWLDSGGLDAAEVLLRRRWYVAAAGGASLFKAGASEWLSRKEVHWFLDPPGDLSFEQAFWLAVARTYAPDLGTALRIARSKIAATPRSAHAFWREVARFFCLNPVPVAEIDDFCDFLAAARAENGTYSLKGRTLVSLRRQMHAWHTDMETIQRIEARRQAALRARLRYGELLPGEWAWTGSELPNWSWRPQAAGRGSRGPEFVAVQLRTAADLVAESRAMHHCVWTYADKCQAGNASIWSLRRLEGVRQDRLLTVELDGRDRAVQVRGFANRSATGDEGDLLSRWFRARGIDH